MRKLTPVAITVMATLALAACRKGAASTPAPGAAFTGVPAAVVDTVIVDQFDAAGTAEPMRLATLSTRLMATINAVAVAEGDHVVTEQSLVRLDARDLVARRVQVDAGIAAARAVHRDAVAHATRMRALYADSAATRVQLDQAETGLARAEAAVASTAGMAGELAATASYANVRAPFAGIVTDRFVDPGSFASPGAPLVTIADLSSLRISVTALPEAVRGLRPGASLDATIGDMAVRAVVEGVVPDGANRYTVNALVRNPDGRFLSGSSARLALPQGRRRALLIPARAVVRQGELTGVRTARSGLRWVTLGGAFGDLIEVRSGVAAGDSVLTPGARN